MTHGLYMKQALNEAEKAFQEDEVPIGSVIVYENRIIARAHNQVKTLKDPTAHAEMIAITQAAAELENERLSECCLYVTIEPCAMCVGAAILARFKSIVYGANDPKTGALGSKIDLAKPGLFNHTLEVVSGVLGTESRAIMQQFFLGKR